MRQQVFTIMKAFVDYTVNTGLDSVNAFELMLKSQYG